MTLNDAKGAKQILDNLQQAFVDAGRPDLVKTIVEWRKTIE